MNGNGIQISTCSDILTCREMMQLGSSVPWQDAMEQIAGTRDMDSQPLVRYFQSLLDWLTEQNQGHSVGWDENCPNIPPSAGHNIPKISLNVLLVTTFVFTILNPGM